MLLYVFINTIFIFIIEVKTGLKLDSMVTYIK